MSSVRGEIQGDAAYTADALIQRGISRIKLQNARLSGIVKPRSDGRNYWYLGSEIIEWLRANPAAEPVTSDGTWQTSGSHSAGCDARPEG